MIRLSLILGSLCLDFYSTMSLATYLHKLESYPDLAEEIHMELNIVQ